MRSISFPNVSWQLYTKPGADGGANIANIANIIANVIANIYMGAITGANRCANNWADDVSDGDANVLGDGIHLVGVDVDGVQVG